jgi:glutaredoxin-like protein
VRRADPVFLSDTDREMLTRALSRGMRDEVRLVLFIDETAVSKELLEFANALASITPKITLEAHNADGGKNQKLKDMKIEHWPAMILTKDDFDRIRYYGIPLGYELPAIVDGLVDLSNMRTPLSPKAKAALATVRRKANIKVFVSVTCPYCPAVARHAYRGAIESPKVTAEIIDVQTFPDLAARHSVMGTPKIVLNDNLDLAGQIGDVEFFEKLRDSDHALVDSIYG